MCLPFICGGGDRGDHGSPAHPSPQQPPRPPPPLPVYVPSDQEDGQAAYKPVVTSPFKEGQAPHQRKGVSASPPLHGSVVAVSHPKEAAEEMRAPRVVHMARPGGGDGYSAAAANNNNNYYGGRDHDRDRHAYGGDEDDRKPQGNSWW
ncbi:hypothetical protein C2845_PM10G09400 [Panicum miliaceum]|uniref:Uncharacterized protein n=1 Tax=Panicum miliaceum TaxID=4540 RepID=A0A3L6PG60_PANMI|nr:hypothetical protein C2845_PM10G09400 [Panicum miliaceum]